MLTSGNVRVAVSGAVMVGPTTSPAPTGTGGTTTGFSDLGYISDAGITETRNRSTNSIKAWQNGDEVRVVVTDGTLTFKFVMLETSLATVQAYYGATVTQTVSEGSFVVVPTSTGGRQSFILDVVDGSSLIRTYVPSGEITDVGDKVYSNGEAIGYEVTVTAYPASTISGNAKVWMTALKS